MAEIDILIPRVARDQHLPASLVEAIVRTESAGVATRWRVEPRYRYLWDVKHGRPFRALTHAEIASEEAPADFHAIHGSSRDTEWWGQQASWGPMQIMGAVAREHGYSGDFPGLCDPLAGLRWGCAHLAQLRDAYLARYGWPGVVAAYNAGSPRRAGGQWVNQSYVDAVADNGGAIVMYGTAAQEPVA